MNDFLEEAGALLRNAANTNETQNRDIPSLLTQGRERIAMKFAQLAAIERGLLPTEMVGDILTQFARLAAIQPGHPSAETIGSLVARVSSQKTQGAPR